MTAIKLVEVLLILNWYIGHICASIVLEWLSYQSKLHKKKQTNKQICDRLAWFVSSTKYFTKLYLYIDRNSLV